MLTALAALLVGCGNNFDDDVRRIAFIGSPTDIEDDGILLAPAGQHVRLATAQGLVGLNEIGELLPAMAERWIVTDDGLSYIFRLRNSEWSDGTAITSQNVRQVLTQTIEQLQGTSLGVDLEIIADIRAMTGRVIEIRLKSPMPQFLQLIAQPELGLRKAGVGTGPMAVELEREPEEGSLTLSALSPEKSGFPARENWQEGFRQVRIISASAAEATARFETGEVDAVFNGSLLTLIAADTGPLASGTLRLDGVLGLFGLQINNSDGMLDEASVREAIAMGIDRSTLLEPFNLGGWTPTSRLVPSDLLNDPSISSDRWPNMSFEQRRAEAKRRVIGWRAQSLSVEARLSILLPESPGTNILFAELAKDFEAIGITLDRAEPGTRADLELVDRLARYADRRWFLNQFNCALERGLCSPEADALVLDSISERDPAATARFLAEAEAELLASQSYIPIGAPIRWSLIRGGVDGFAENSWGLHPLFPMALRPI